MVRSKRKTVITKRKYIQSASTSSSTLSSESGGLQVSPCQLRELWCYDNECGYKYMRGCPLRTCSLLDRSSDGTESNIAGLSPEEMILVKSQILHMWQKAGSIFEVFTLKDEEQEGFRLRVRKDLAVKVSMKQQDEVHIGWIAKVPSAVSSVHIYKRSAVAPAGYLGGPGSYINWSPSNKQTVNIRQSISKHKSFMCFLFTIKPLNAGVELRWDYGCSRDMPDLGVWFKDECCRISNVNPADLKRFDLHQKRRSFVYRELCVLCGHPYSLKNKENRINRKQHLTNKHADFLGSAWNGTGVYRQQPVSIDTLSKKVDELNHLLTSLKQMKWNVLPACKIFTKCEMEFFGADVDAVMDEFNRRRDLFKKGGTLILRGTDVPSSATELEPITPSCWKVLTWEDGKKPINGRYAVSDPSEGHDVILNSVVQNFCEKYFEGDVSECDSDID